MNAKIVLVLWLLSLGGCHGQRSLVYETDRDVTFMLCDVAQHRILIMKRFSFEMPSLLKIAPCGQLSSGFSYDKLSDGVYVGSEGVFASDNFVTFTAEYSMSFLGGQEKWLEMGFPIDEFIEYKLADEARSNPRVYPQKVERLVVKGYQCVRFNYGKKSIVSDWGETVEYWCWEGESGLSVPFGVSAHQRVSAGGDGVDIERNFIEPFFDTLKINRLSEAEIERINQNRRGVCAEQKERFDKGLIWGDDYPDKRLFMARLHFCGYDYPLLDLKIDAP